MKKSIRVSKKVYLLAIVLALLVIGTGMVFGKAIINEFTFDINQFKANIQASPDECWRNPAQNRKDTVSNKLTELQQLITEENFEEAYDKLLYDIKPKLTGLKQNEHGEPWGNGVYEKAWVTCVELRVSFEEESNLILSQINPLSVYDDDKTPPSISIQYEGEGHVANPGVWHVYIEDLKSGLDTVVITVNEIEEVYDLQGEPSVSYDVLVPAIAQVNMMEVIATNDDKDYVGDQETSAETDWVEIFADVDDDTPPSIVFYYDGGNSELNPGIWIVVVQDLESGLDEVNISVDGDEITYDFNGETTIQLEVNVPGIEGLHTIEVTAVNNDKDYIGDQESWTESDEILIYYVPPIPLP